MQSVKQNDGIDAMDMVYKQNAMLKKIGKVAAKEVRICWYESFCESLYCVGKDWLLIKKSNFASVIFEWIGLLTVKQQFIDSVEITEYCQKVSSFN